MNDYIPTLIVEAIEQVEKQAMPGWIEMNTATFRTLERNLQAIPISNRLLLYHVEQDNSVGFYDGLPIFISERLGNNVVHVTPRLAMTERR